MKNKFERNISFGEVVYRIVLTVAFMIVAGALKGLGATSIVFALIAGAISMYFFITALTGWDPIYVILNYKSNRE